MKAFYLHPVFFFFRSYYYYPAKGNSLAQSLVILVQLLLFQLKLVAQLSFEIQKLLLVFIFSLLNVTVFLFLEVVLE